MTHDTSGSDLVNMGEGIGYVNVCYFDKNGRQIRDLDLLRVFHFVGARRKRHYMYKWVRRNEEGRMSLLHLCAPDTRMTLLAAVVNKDGVFADAEIVQRGKHG